MTRLTSNIHYQFLITIQYNKKKIALNMPLRWMAQTHLVARLAHYSHFPHYAQFPA
jgi:hypothetical protein